MFYVIRSGAKFWAGFKGRKPSYRSRATARPLWSPSPGEAVQFVRKQDAETIMWGLRLTMRASVRGVE